MNELLKDRLYSIVKICLQIIEEDTESRLEREKIFEGGGKTIPFNPALWNFVPTPGESQNSRKNAALSFNEKELNLMPKNLKKEFKDNRKKAHVRRRNGRYEIRFQFNKKRIAASGGTLKAAKEKFIAKLWEIFAPGEIERENTRDVLFGDYVCEWLETVKKPYIKPPTYRFYEQAIRADLLPRFKDRPIRSIGAFELQKFLGEFADEGRLRTAKKAHLILNAVFEYAVADGVIDRSPMKKVVVGAYEQKHGTALTRAEEKRLIDALFEKPESVNRQAFVFLVYTGLRRSELSTVEISDGWVTVTSAKQRLGKSEKKRRIPISPMLEKVLPMIDVAAIKKIAANTLTGKFKILMPDHHLHELRHTFITRCRECGISRECVSLWAGHAADGSITTTVYTHLSQFEEKQRDEIALFIYDY